MNAQMFGRSTLSLSSVERKGSSVSRDDIFNEIAMQARTLASNRQAKAIKASHGPRVSPESQAMERAKKMENPKRSLKERKVRSKFPEAQANVKHRKRVSQVLKI